VSLLGCSNEELLPVLAALGWQTVEVADGKAVWRRALAVRPPKPHGRKQPHPPKIKVDPTSPFAGLAELIGGK